MTRVILTLLLALGATLTWPGPIHAQGKPADCPLTWYEYDAQKQIRVNLHLFYSENCPHCTQAIDFAKDLEKRKPWVQVKYYEVSRVPANRQLYESALKYLNRTGGLTPALFYCKTVQVGYLSDAVTGQAIERDLGRWYEALTKPRPAPTRPQFFMPPPVELEPFDPDELPPLPDLDAMPAAEEPADLVYIPGQGEVDASRMSLPALTVVLASCDAFNPCAFFVLLTLLSVLVHSRSRAHMLLVGGVFVFFSGAMYFLFMTAWLNLFVLLGHMREITITAGIVAAVAALLNIKDFFAFKSGPTLSIPQSAKPSLFQRMSKLVAASKFSTVLAGTAGLAFATNLYEMLCTAGFPMVYTRVLTLHDLPAWNYYLYLLAYNVIYVVPMAMIVLAFSYTLGTRKLTEHEGRVLKLLSGAMLLALAVSLLVKPEWLYSTLGALAVMGTAIGTTALIVLGEWLFWRRDRLELPGSEAANGRVTSGR